MSKGRMGCVEVPDDESWKIETEEEGEIGIGEGFVARGVVVCGKDDFALSRVNAHSQDEFIPKAWYHMVAVCMPDQ